MTKPIKGEIIKKEAIGMKKIGLVLILSIMFLFGCETATETADEAENPEIQAGEGLPVEIRSLSDLQIAACETADDAGTCDTRLAEVGIVLKEECCEILNKCC